MVYTRRRDTDNHEEDPMPDADDFDVEYFRNLMKGNKPVDGTAPPAPLSPPAVKKSASPKDKVKASVARKKNKNR